MGVKHICLFCEETPQPWSDPPNNQNDTMAKDAWWVRKLYWRRERAHDKTGKRVVFVVCTTGAFIRRVDTIKSEYITKGEKMIEVC